MRNHERLGYQSEQEGKAAGNLDINGNDAVEKLEKGAQLLIDKNDPLVGFIQKILEKNGHISEEDAQTLIKKTLYQKEMIFAIAGVLENKTEH